MVKEAIKTVNLSKKYGKNLVVDDLNISIDSGEIVGFLGLNGAGKTTTISIKPDWNVKELLLLSLLFSPRRFLF